MAQRNPMESLQTLLRLRQPSHVQTTDPFLSRRQSEIASGADMMVEDADSPQYKMQQIADSRATGVALPRADYRSADVTKLRSALKLKAIEDAAEMERAAVAPRVAGEFNIKERELANAGQMAVTQEQNRGMLERDKALIESGLDPTRIRIPGVNQPRSESTNRPEPPTGSQTTALSKARQAYQGGGMNTVRRMFGFQPSGRQDYEAALNDVLVRSGSLESLQQALPEIQQAQGGTIQERIIAAGYDPTGLSPYEVEWLKLQLGE